MEGTALRDMAGDEKETAAPARKRERSPGFTSGEGSKRSRQDDGRAATVQLLDLPADVVEMIMLISEARTAIRFLSSCRRARSLIATNDVLWKRKVVADFGFPGVRFEPATSLSCPGWKDVYVAHHNLLHGRYELLAPGPSRGARDSSYDPTNDLECNGRPAVSEQDLAEGAVFQGEPNPVSSPESVYDSDDPDHVVHADEIGALKADVEIPVSTLVSPEQWDAYAVYREPGKLTQAQESSASLRAFPRHLIDGRITAITGRTDLFIHPRRRIRALGYNDTFDLFLGRTGERLWVAEVERSGGLGAAVWRSAPGDKLEPLAFRSDVIVLAVGAVVNRWTPVAPLVRVVWGLGSDARQYDMDATSDATDVAVMPAGRSVVSVAVCFVKVSGDLLAMLATVLYTFDLKRRMLSDEEERMDGSCRWTGMGDGDLDAAVRKERWANVMLVYRVDRRGESVKLVRGHDLTTQLHHYANEWESFRDKSPHAEDLDVTDLTWDNVRGIAERWEYKSANHYVHDFTLHGRIALLCVRGFDFVTIDPSWFLEQGHVVCFDILSGAVTWNIPIEGQLDRIGPISRDGSVVLLQKHGALIGVTFRKLEEQESWEADLSWPTERIGINEYVNTLEVEHAGGESAKGEEEEEDKLRKLGLVKSLVYNAVAVWNQERVDG
ncbi:hypothetical protein HK101_006171, partial [Irineochytrium annulatum]